MKIKEPNSGENHFEALFMNAGIGVGYYTTDGQVIAFNVLAAKHMNGRPEDFAGKSIFDIFPDDLAKTNLKRLQQSARSDENLVFEDQVPLPTGKKYFLSTYTRIKDLNNDITGIQIMSQEITYIKEIEESLRNSEDRFRKLFEFAPDAYFLSNFKGTLVDGNLAAEKLIGQKREELTGKNYLKLNLLSAQDIAKAAKLLIKNSLGQSTGPDVFVLQRKDGVRVPVEISTYPIKIKKQSLVLGVARDITERIKYESEISASNKKNLEASVLLNSVLDSIPDIIGIQNNNHEIVRYNKAGYDFLKKTPEEVAGKKCYNLIGREQRCEICSTAESYTTRKNAQHQQYFPELNMWFDMRSYPILDSKGEIVYIIEHLRDITDIKKIEQNLTESKNRAEESDRLKSAFLANMSHEIRTPMNGVLGFAELLKNPLLGEAEKQEYINIICKSGNRMLRILNDLIDVSKIESGQMEISYSGTSLNEQTRYVYTFFRPAAEEKRLGFSYTNALPDNKDIIETDKVKLVGILTNLVSNAIKFTNSGSVEFGYKISDSFIEFFVRDTGTGISNKLSENIFERFRQGDDSLTRNYEGTGLGLYIVKNYTEMLGGKIWFRNNRPDGDIKGGVTFYFTIPNKPHHHISINDRNSRTGFIDYHEPVKLKILIADDDEASLLLLSHILKPFSKQILFARTAIQAVEAYLDNPDTDVILMDIKMAEMDGFEATRQIRHFNDNIVIIAQTAYAQKGDRENAILAGCNDYVSKPVNKEELIGKIKMYLKKI